MKLSDYQIHYWAHMLDEAFNKHMLTEGKHWPADYVKTGINLVKASQLGQQSWYLDSYIQQNMQTFANEFEPLSHKNSNLGFFSTIVKWFIAYSGTSKEKYQEFIKRKLDGIIGTLQVILNDPSYDKIKDGIKQKWTLQQFEELQNKISDEAFASSDEKLKNIIARNDYEVIPIYSYEELHEKFGGNKTGYKGQSEWCHTNGKSTYESWTKNGTQMFFVLAKKDWQKITPPDPQTTNAYDEYGLSLIAILIDVISGNLLNETLRWNHVIEPGHTNPGASVDKAFKNNWGELSQAVGINVKNEVARLIKDKQNKIRKKLQNANEEAIRILQNTKIITNTTIPKEIRQLITKVDIPNSVTGIGPAAFYGCTSLMSVTIPDSVTSIGSFAFNGCSNLTSVTIPDSVTSIGALAFEKCSGLTSVTIPDSVTSLRYSVFHGCSSLTSIIIPNSVTSIGAFAFEKCSSLTSVTIPNSVISIGEDSFYSCNNLINVTFEGKTLAQVKAMMNYPFGIKDESIIKGKN